MVESDSKKVAYCYVYYTLLRTQARGFSSVGRALALHARGHRFDSGILHGQKAMFIVTNLTM